MEIKNSPRSSKYICLIFFAENIAFGVPGSDIDLSRVKRAAADAQLSEFIESFPDGYNTFVKRGALVEANANV